jgi:hypothetical protein
MDRKVTGVVESAEEVVAGIDELVVRVQGEGTTLEGKVSRLGLNLSQAHVEKAILLLVEYSVIGKAGLWK